MAWRSCARAASFRPRYCCVSLHQSSQLSSIPAALIRLRAQPAAQLTPLVFRNLTTSKCLYQREPPTQDAEGKPPTNKPGLIQRFKQMYRDYWYVLVPVHLLTSAVWMGGFYYMVRSGVDIVGTMEWLGVSDSITHKLRDSQAGYFALTYACYKVATPLRYTVTLGGTTVSIRKLTELGWIKPVPSTERLREIYQEKKEGFQDAYAETKLELKQKTELMKERHGHVMEDLKRYKQEMQDLKKREVKK